MQQVLEEFGDVMPHELVAQVPPRRAVYHKIELEPGAKPAEKRDAPPEKRKRPSAFIVISFSARPASKPLRAKALTL